MNKILNKYHPELFIEAASKEEYRKISEYLNNFGYGFVTTYNNTATHHFSCKYSTTLKDKIMKRRPIRRLLRNS
jgi:hypothetical protein